ncbi:MAG: peptide chain release factor N(5)-glutamine methyltransferase [Phycisphaerae bacterium]|jgi:release factor glutamine methyltransferase
MAEIWNIQKLLDWLVGFFTEKKIDSPRLTAEMLLSFVLGMKRIELYMHFDKPVEQAKLEQLRSLVKRCVANEPVQYLVGSCEFYSMTFKVCSDCLIPRPETELLVERAVEFLRTRAELPVQYICDLCTGSGCIATAIAKNYKGDCKVIATDICDKALAVAAENIAKYNLAEKVQLLRGDLFEPIIEQLDVREFDLLVSNPPYVSDAEYENLDAKVKNYEPKLALAGGVDGLDIYKRIIAGAANHLKKDGALMLEIGYQQGDAVKDMLEKTNLFANIIIEKDFNNNDRIITGFRTQ